MLIHILYYLMYISRMGGITNVFYKPLLHEIVSLLNQQDWSISVFREVNRCADLLARKGHGASLKWVLLDSVCPTLGLILADDARSSLLPWPT